MLPFLKNKAHYFGYSLLFSTFSIAFTSPIPLEISSMLEAEDALLFGAEADIGFGIADIKYSENAIKILEFGEGPRSKFEGYDQLHGAGSIWKQIWEWLFELHPKIFYIDTYMTNRAEEERINLDYFKQRGGRVFKNIRQLINSSDFKRARNNDFKRTQLISDYSGVVMFRHQNPSNETIAAFKKQYPEFIVFDAGIASFVNNKQKTDSLFTEEPFKQFRPHAQCYEKAYSPELVENILTDFPEEILVIKPLNSCKGNGVIITHRNDLDETLQMILQKTQGIELSDDTSYSYWTHDRNKTFLIESYEPSRPLEFEGKTYDATLRIVYALMLHAGAITVRILDGYWKLPFKAQEEEGTLTEKAKSKINTSRHSSCILSEEDRIVVGSKFMEFMPQLYKKMLTNGVTNPMERSVRPHSPFLRFIAEEILASRTKWLKKKR